MNIDLKDRKILYQLDQNSRQTLSRLGKKVGLHENGVAYRLNRLEKQGIIKNYYTVVDAYKLGYLPVRFYLKFQFTSPDIEERIIDYFKDNEKTWWVVTLEGKYDFAVNMLVKSMETFSNFWDETLKRFIHYIEEQVFTQYFHLTSFEYSYLLDKTIVGDRKKYKMINDGKLVDIKDVDLNILKIIGPNARMPLSKIAEKLDLTPAIVRYRLNKMQKLNIIQGYRVNINFEKIGYGEYKLDINLGDYSKRPVIINYVKKNPNLVHISKSAGVSDVELTFHVQNLEQLLEIISDIQNRIPNVIRNYRYLHIRKQHKWENMPLD